MSVDALSNTAEHAQATLSYHGKSFRFAQWFLDERTAYDAARLYQFCRILDDVVDESEADEAVEAYSVIQKDIAAGYSKMPWLMDYFALKQHYHLSTLVSNDLIDTIYSDLSEVRIQNPTELINYCYGVAGTVGCLMRPILRAPKEAEPFAIDLGIAMQLTNIARDVLTDAQNHRCYLPADWIEHMSPDEIVKASGAQKQLVVNAIERLLQLAESYYASASYGIQAIPVQNRRAIGVAMLVYREIGMVLMARQCDYQKGRVFVPFWRKCILAVKAVLRFRHDSVFRLPKHDDALHQPIQAKVANI